MDFRDTSQRFGTLSSLDTFLLNTIDVMFALGTQRGSAHARYPTVSEPIWWEQEFRVANIDVSVRGFVQGCYIAGDTFDVGVLIHQNGLLAFIDLAHEASPERQRNTIHVEKEIRSNTHCMGRDTATSEQRPTMQDAASGHGLQTSQRMYVPAFDCWWKVGMHALHEVPYEAEIIFS